LNSKKKRNDYKEGKDISEDEMADNNHKSLVRGGEWNSILSVASISQWSK